MFPARTCLPLACKTKSVRRGKQLGHTSRFWYVINCKSPSKNASSDWAKTWRVAVLNISHIDTATRTIQYIKLVLALQFARALQRKIFHLQRVMFNIYLQNASQIKQQRRRQSQEEWCQQRHVLRAIASLASATIAASQSKAAIITAAAFETVVLKQSSLYNTAIAPPLKTEVWLICWHRALEVDISRSTINSHILFGYDSWML